MQKKICFVLNSPIGGGAERFMIHLINNLSRERFDIYLILFKKDGEYFHLIKNDITIVDLNIRAFELNKPIHPAWIWQLGLALKRVHPQIIFSTMGSTNFMCTQANAWMNIKAKVVIREAGILSRHLVEDRWAGLKKTLYKLCLSQVHAVAFPSRAMADDLEHYLHCQIKTKRIIPNFLDTQYLNQKLQESWDPDQFKVKTDKNIVVSLGRLEKIKGIDLGIHAFFEVQKRIPAYYWILGQGTEEKKLKELVKQLGISESTYFLGFQENPYSFLKHADVFLLPSRSEGFPNALLEAMYCRLPAVASQYSTSTEELLGCEEGLVVPNEDPKAMAQAVETILNNRPLADSMRENAHKKAGQFSKENVVRQYEQLFFEMTSS